MMLLLFILGTKADNHQVAFSLLCFFVIIGAKSGTGRLDADLTQDEIVISMRVITQDEFIYTCIDQKF